MKPFIAGIATIALLPQFSLACVQDNFLPPNNLHIPVTEKNSGLSEERYHDVIDKVERIYSPIVTADGAELKIDRLWESSTVNAGTFRDERGKHWHINLYGGFARLPLITEDGFALVICHEIGHHLGGAPKKNIETASWSSNEGQADYFATLKCLRRIFEKEDNEAINRAQEIPEIVSENCQESFPDKKERALCIRNSMAGLAVARINATIQGTNFPSFETPDETEVGSTNEKHPRAQCRLDTYFMGSICEVGHNTTLSQTNEVKGTCHSSLGHTSGIRPTCWFKPSR